MAETLMPPMDEAAQLAEIKNKIESGDFAINTLSHLRGDMQVN